MEYNKLFLFLFLLISGVNLLLPDDTRKEFLRKYTKKGQLNLKEHFKKYKPLKLGFPYDKTKIKEIMNKYSFPEKFNYLEENKITPHIKDQQRCGCCWSDAATSALAYRYKKLGLNLDLSPQYGLSCYIQDCEKGAFNLVEAEIDLEKNGTVTEECVPFSSGDGKTVEKCPTKCKDGSELKKYYSQNAYSNEFSYTDDVYYDMVALIMDQLIAYGPVVTGIIVYTDFFDLNKDKERCIEEVYTYNGTAQMEGGHALTIVGYGILNNKYYWLIQNSWGEEVCDKGFVKIEFGQVGVENYISFGEPYIHDSSKTPKKISVEISSYNQLCQPIIKLDEESKQNWINTLSITYQNDINKDWNIEIHCNPFTFPNKTKIIDCYPDTQKLYAFKGNYKLTEIVSLGEDNSFQVKAQQDSFQNYALDEIRFIYKNNYYVSEEGSRIVFNYTSLVKESFIPPIYPNFNAKNSAFKNCKKLDDLPLVYCDIGKDELDIVQNINTPEPYPIIYSILCYWFSTTNVYLFKLDKTKYPVFHINSLVILKTGNSISINNPLYISANVEGIIPPNQKNQFYALAKVEYNSINKTAILICDINASSNSCEIPCRLNINMTQYDNVYLLPFIALKEIKHPYEVFIKEEKKGMVGEKPTIVIPEKPVVDSSESTKFSLVLLLIFLIF